MKVWERRLMKDFHVAPVEISEENDDDVESEERDKVPDETPLDRFRRISKQVASQSANIKWNDVLRRTSAEAYSQIGRSKNRESFKNQQNLLKAMDQAKRLIAKSPTPSSPNISDHYNLDQTNQTLIALLKNISEEINELTPNQMCSRSQRSITPTPLQSLNVQLQAMLSKTPSPYQTRSMTKRQQTSPMPSENFPSKTFDSRKNSVDDKLNVNRPVFRVERPKSPIGMISKNIKQRTPTPDSVKSFNIPVIEINTEQQTSDIQEVIPLAKIQNESPPKVVKRKAPSNPPAVSVDERKTITIPTFSTTPATPLPSVKSINAPINHEKPKSPSTSPPPIFSSAIASFDNVNNLSTEELVPKARSPSPKCLRPVKKIDDVNTIKRQPKGGWL
jgi:transient-receptor-potential-like protein